MNNTLQKFSSNQYGKDYVVGDIHGMYYHLLSCLQDIGFDKSKDRLFCVGDLIDRGPESFKCLSLCYEPWFFTVVGNHEMMMYDSLLGGGSSNMWMQNGGEWINNVDVEALKVTAQDLYEKLPLGIQVEGEHGSLVGIVHADVHWSQWDKNFENLGCKEINTMLWSRTRIKRGWGQPVTGVDKLYVGHTPAKEKRIINNVHHIDCGAVFETGHFHIEAIL